MLSCGQDTEKESIEARKRKGRGTEGSVPAIGYYKGYKSVALIVLSPGLILTTIVGGFTGL